MRERLAAARAAGLGFEDAWEEIWPTITWPRGKKNCSGEAWQHRAALRGTREEWRCAYVGEPTPLSTALRGVIVTAGEDRPLLAA
jgi:hypothetical protein